MVRENIKLLQSPIPLIYFPQRHGVGPHWKEAKVKQDMRIEEARCRCVYVCMSVRSCARVAYVSGCVWAVFCARACAFSPSDLNEYFWCSRHSGAICLRGPTEEEVVPSLFSATVRERPKSFTKKKKLGISRNIVESIQSTRRTCYFWFVVCSE